MAEDVVFKANVLYDITIYFKEENKKEIKIKNVLRVNGMVLGISSPNLPSISVGKTVTSNTPLITLICDDSTEYNFNFNEVLYYKLESQEIGET